MRRLSDDSTRELINRTTKLVQIRLATDSCRLATAREPTVLAVALEVIVTTPDGESTVMVVVP
jgi:hypothetical protein